MTGFAIHHDYDRHPHGIKDFASAKAYLEKARDQEKGRPLPGSATRLEWANMERTKIGVRYHDTFVLIWDAEDTIELYTRGYRTMTTRRRMNTYLPEPWMVYTEEGVWYLSEGSYGSLRSVFVEGITIRLNASALGRVYQPRDGEEEKKLILWERQIIRTYAAHYLGLLWAGSFPVPQASQCLQCFENDHPALRYSADNHLRRHVLENRYPSKLIFNALKAAGYNDWVLKRLRDYLERSTPELCAKKKTLVYPLPYDAMKRALVRFLLTHMGHSV